MENNQGLPTTLMVARRTACAMTQGMRASCSKSIQVTPDGVLDGRQSYTKGTGEVLCCSTTCLVTSVKSCHVVSTCQTTSLPTWFFIRWIALSPNSMHTYDLKADTHLVPLRARGNSRPFCHRCQSSLPPYIKTLGFQITGRLYCKLIKGT